VFGQQFAQPVSTAIAEDHFRVEIGRVDLTDELSAASARRLRRAGSARGR
jgi:hypothetical protein